MMVPPSCATSRGFACRERGVRSEQTALCDGGGSGSDELEANPTLRSSMNHILIASLVDQLLQRYKQEQQGALANEARMEDRERRQSAPHKKQGEHAPVKKRNSRLRAHVTEENFQLGLEQARVLARDKNGS